MSIAALIFDVDGTIADTEEAHRLAFNQAFADHGLLWDWGMRRYAQLLRVSGGKERIAAYIETLRATTLEKQQLLALVPVLHETKTRRYLEMVRRRDVPLRPGVARLLREAKSAGLRLAIASTTTADNVTALLAAALGPKSPSLFDVIACGDQVRAKKPAPDIYLHALASLDLEPGECVAFEDSNNGLVAARAAGLFTVITPTAWTHDEDFRGADLLLAGLGDPDFPLDEVTAQRVGAHWLGLREIERLVDERNGKAQARVPATTRRARWNAKQH